jgi:hypothetical protein
MRNERRKGARNEQQFNSKDNIIYIDFINSISGDG